MAVVALREVEEPHPVLVTVYTVQAYWLDRGVPKRGRLSQHVAMETALRVGKAAGGRSPLVVVQRVRGNVEADYWEPATTLATFGEHDARL